jgi:hypothetical protein
LGFSGTRLASAHQRISASPGPAVAGFEDGATVDDARVMESSHAAPGSAEWDAASVWEGPNWTGRSCGRDQMHALSKGRRCSRGIGGEMLPSFARMACCCMTSHGSVGERAWRLEQKSEYPTLDAALGLADAHPPRARPAPAVVKVWRMLCAWPTRCPRCVQGGGQYVGQMDGGSGWSARTGAFGRQQPRPEEGWRREQNGLG